ncbi:MAG: S8/S53 family peptidase [Bacteroidia bacterium]
MIRNLSSFLTTVFIVLSVLSSRAQVPEAKLNLGLARKVATAEHSATITVLVKGDPAAIRTYTETHGGHFKNSAGDIAWIETPLNSIAGLTRLSAVKRIEAYSGRMRTMNDTMRYLCRVDEVHQGISPLSQAYDGSGVIIGYIDSGIDLAHPDFQDSLGLSRVLWLWDTKLPVSSNTPQPYGYGQEWDKAGIDAGLATAHNGQDEYGHGCYVAGIGSGDGSSVGHFQGVAPKSDIIVVNYDFTAQDTLPRVAHAVEYIFNKAALLGKPCVINASLGDYYGSHDGRDLQSQYIRNLIIAQPGRALVAAAGNVGIVYPFHVGTTTTAGDTSFSWFKYNSGIPGAYCQIFADTADFNNISFAIGADKVTPDFSFRGRTAFRNIQNTLGLVNLNLVNGGNRIGRIQLYGSESDGVYSLEVYVIPDSTTYHWRFETTGNGHFDSWTFDWVFQNLPAPGVFPDIVNYNPPDTNQSIVSGFACLDEVLTVGNYYNTDRHIDYNGTLQVSPGDRPRQLAENSSRGPTRDGRIKPDICAPGHHILSTGVTTLIPGMIAAQPWKVAPGGYHVTGGGTSASAPVVAGVAALYLQKNPGATYQDIKDAILGCAMTDSLTWGPYPNAAWGFGKVDAFGVMTACGAVGLSDEPTRDNALLVYPNPADGFVTVQIADPSYAGKGRIRIFDISGRLVLEPAMVQGVFKFSTENFPSGSYLIQFTDDAGNTSRQPLIIRH